MKAWIDIDNPEQVRYLLPVARRFERAGHDVLVTARADGDTFAILRREGAEFEGVGLSFGKGLLRTLSGLRQRTRMLADLVRGQTTPVDFLLTGSRAATVTAGRLGIPSFVIVDDEFATPLVSGLSGASILYPSVIPANAFRRRGIRRERLLPFPGLRQDISFADVDLSSMPPHDFGCDASVPLALVHPPAEDGRFGQRGRQLSVGLLRRLAAAGVKVVFAPRQRGQEAYLDEVSRWEEAPIVLRASVEPVSLLMGVDAVFSAGGTMLREAAYLGVPSYGLFRGPIRAVDRHLVSLGRLSVVESLSDVGSIRLVRNRAVSPLREVRGGPQTAMEMIVRRAEGARRGGR